ncbi:FkbM family methyltransferase [Synechococcus elongatus IITB4]|uniref:FkbM family methyltransferase n=1 Tax=Synechococcus elongatus TaxID=32046 RepID=UPI0030D1E157
MKAIDTFLLWKLRPATASDWIKRVLRWKRKRIKCQHGEFWVDTASNFGFKIAYTNGEYEPEMICCLSNILRHGDTFIDLGSNEGFFSVIASKLVGQSGRVIAIEPQQRLHNVLLTNFSLNQCLNINLECLAIGKKNDFVSFNLAPSTNTGSSGIVRATKYRVPQEIVRITTLTELIRKNSINKSRIIKIDIEGGEYDAILGSQEIFRAHLFDYIALELHPSQLERQGLSCRAITDFLTECGYTIDTRFSNLVLKSPNTDC